jgi:hypothetical protein
MRDSQIQDIKEREEIYKNHDKSDIHLTLARIAARSVHASSFFLNNRPELFEKYAPNHDDIVYMKETAKQLEKYPLLNDEEKYGGGDYSLFPEAISYINVSSGIGKQILKTARNSFALGAKTGYGYPEDQVQRCREMVNIIDEKLNEGE